MSQCEALAKGRPCRGLMKNGGKSLVRGIKKGMRSKHSVIPGSDDVINVNDIISPPETYIRRYKTIKFHTKRSEAKGRRLILHPQVIGINKWCKMAVHRVG